jgi:hypothetical protein
MISDATFFLLLALTMALAVAVVWLVAKAQKNEEAEELDEIVAVSETANGVVFTFRSGNRRGLEGVTLEQAEREVGVVGDKVPKRQWDRVPGPTPEPPVAVADLKKPPS